MAKPKKKIYRFTGREGKFTAEEKLKEWIQNHEDHHVVKGHFFGREVLLSVLDQPGCMGIRFYHAINDNGEKTLVLAGVDGKGAAIWGSSSGSRSLTAAKNVGGADLAWPCPPYC